MPSRYKPDSFLGKGGFGQVYKVYDTELDKIVAIKILTNVTPASRSSLKKEFEVLSKLSHPHLVKVYSFGFISNNVPYFTMEYIDGENLVTFLSNPNTSWHLPHIIDQSLLALGYLHEKLIIHGDIKPENIFISTSGNNDVSVKILDFGLASSIEEIPTHASGTPRFMAPEVFSKQDYSPVSDLYALGMTLIESFTGMQAPIARDISSSFYKSAHNQLSDLLASSKVPNPSAIASFILTLADQDLANRPENAFAALQRFKVIIDVSSHDMTSRLDNVFIGRARELDVIHAFIHRNNADTRFLILEGPTGIGKKALMNRAIALAQPKGYFVLDLSDASFTSNTIERIVDTISNNLPPSKRDAFLDRHSKILELVQARTDAKKSATDNVRVAYSNIIGYLRAISGEDPILLSIPDIERFSEDFHQFVDQLVHELHLADINMRLIISCNTDKPLAQILSDARERSSALGYSERIDVEPFMNKELEELQLTLFNRILFNKHQTQHIIKETEGIPLLILEYIKHLIAHDAIQFEDSTWTLNQSSYAEMPIARNITAYFEDEYSKYDRLTKYLLQLIAFWSRDIARDELSKLSNITSSEIDRYLFPLIESMIIKRIGTDSFRITHDAYTKYIEKKTSKKKAKSINESILEYLTDIASTDYERLAMHSLAALSIDQSMKFVFQAVDLLEQRLEYHKCYELLSKQKALLLKQGHHKELIKVLNRLAPIEPLIGYYHDALNDYKQLFDSTDDDIMKAIYSKSIVEIYYIYLGDPQSAKGQLNTAMLYANKCNDPKTNAELLFISGMIDRDNRETFLQKASALADDVDVNLYAKIISQLSIWYMQAGNYDKAYNLRQEMYNLLERVDPTYRRHLYGGLYNSTFYTGEYSKAKVYTEECINTNTDLCDEIGLIENYNNLGGLYYIQGHFNEQIGVLKILINNIQRFNTYDCSFYYGNLALAYRSVADYRKAYEALGQASYYYNNLIGKFASSWTLSKYSYHYALMGDKENENYKKYLKKTITTAKRTNNSIALGHTKLVKTLYHYQRLQHAYASRNTYAALEIFRKANDRDDIVDALRFLTMILIENGELEKAQTAAREARKIFDEIHCDYLKPQLLLAEGALARAQQSDTAEVKLKEALKTSKKMFTREYTWQIQRELALHYKHRSELHKALQYYRDAIDMIKEITETIDGEELKTSYLSLPFRKRVFDEIKSLKKQLD